MDPQTNQEPKIQNTQNTNPPAFQTKQQTQPKQTYLAAIIASQHDEDIPQQTKQQTVTPPIPQNIIQQTKDTQTVPQIVQQNIQSQQKPKQPQTQKQTANNPIQQPTKKQQITIEPQIKKQPTPTVNIKDPLFRSSMKVDQSLSNTKNKQKIIQSLSSQQKKQAPKIQEKMQKQADIKQQQNSEIKELKQEDIRLDQFSNVALQRPISINIGKDLLQIEKQDVVTFKQPEAKIKITEVAEKGFALNKKLYFRIVGQDKHGPIDMFRTLQQFLSLRKLLLERWPGCFVPPVLIQSQIKSQKLKNIQTCKHLQQFLKKLSYFEQIYYKEQIQLFLRSYGIDMEEMFAQMPVLRAKDVIQRFKGCFGQFVEQQNLPKNASTIAKFATSLKKITHRLQGLSKKVLKLAQSYQVYKQAMPKFSTFLSNYQNSLLSQYTNDPNRTIVLRDSQQKINKLKILKQKDNIFYDLYFLLESQNSDAAALSEIIIAMQMFVIRKDQLQAQAYQTKKQIDQVILGHKNIKMMATRKTKQQLQMQLEQKQKKIAAEKQVVLELTGIAQIVLANLTIPLFKKVKVDNYFHLIKSWVETVGDTNMEICDVWKFLAEQSQQQIKKCNK